MKLEQQVCSLELAKRLKELGVEQESLFWWNIWGDSCGEPFVASSRRGLARDMSTYLFSAFTVAELGEMLPRVLLHEKRLYELYFKKDYLNDDEEWFCRYQFRTGYFQQQGNTEADARAKCLIHLIESGIVKV